jgi:cyclomaltodextrinase
MDKAEWFQDAVIYQIFIDRFSGFTSTDAWEQPVFLGGTIQGIIDRLPYLADLGVSALWITPFYKTSAYHGYHITDFYEVDPHFGTTQDIKDLIHEAHQRQIRILADFVPNHCSNQHPFFKDAQQNKDSEYKDWFCFTNWPNEYLCFLSVPELPKLNLGNPATRDHIVNAAKHWLSMGFDGFRLDHVIGPSHTFWKYFNEKIITEYPQALLIGEAWLKGIKRSELRTVQIHHKLLTWLTGGAAPEGLFREYIGELDGVLDFKVQEIIKKYITASSHSDEKLMLQLNHHYSFFPTSFLLPTFLDNHDMDRFLFQCGNDLEKLKNAASVQFSLDQPAIIYYGTEAGMSQTKSIWSSPSNGDIQARQPMNWTAQNDELLKFYKTIIKQKTEKKKK